MKRANVPCGACHLCCQSDVIMILPDDGDDVNSYEHDIVTLDGIGTGAILKKKDGHCIYLCHDGCSIHDRAPVVCRTFDCRRWFLSKTRTERRLMTKTGMADKAIFDRGRELLGNRENSK